MNTKHNVGGQAVIEGIMMRSPSSLAVAVRRANGEIVVKEQPWESIWDRFTFLRWPFIRGSIVLMEAMVNGIQALTFSADQAMADEELKTKNTKNKSDEDTADQETDEEQVKPMSRWMLWGTIILSLLFGFALFKGVPHLVATGLGYVTGDEITTKDPLFHIIDGAVKILIFVGYVWGISLMEDMRRVFQYHGAEHKAIYTYETGQDLTVENARSFTTLHPRCGTSFIMVVLLLSIFVFGAVFPFLPQFSENRVINALLQIAVKLPLMFPVAGLAYEFNRFAGKHMDNWLVRILIKPGLWLQLITTKEPTDDQLEIALVALRKSLWREEVGIQAVAMDSNHLETFASYADVQFGSEPVQA